MGDGVRQVENSMDDGVMIREALDAGRSALDEAESKRLLAAWGIPVVEERVAADEEECVLAARSIGYPVVLKALGSSVLHKTERGLVRLGLTSDDELRWAARRVAAVLAGEPFSYLLQPQVEGQREFLLGLSRDPALGPVIAFGVGGVLAEALDDVCLRLAPLAPGDAEEMLHELRSQRLLEAFRGEDAVDLHAVAAALLGLSDLAGARPEVAEVDVNPLRVRPDGSVVAVDGLVALRPGPQPPTPPRPGVSPEAFRRVFAPRSVAVVGASTRFGRWGHTLATNVLAGGFEGEVHLVNPKGGSLAGRPLLKGIPGLPLGIDLAVLTVPAATVPGMVPELAARGVGAALVVSSGFGETGEEGRRLQDHLVDEAQRVGLSLFGPNTMGVCNPKARFYCTGAHVRPEAGSVALVSQSGNMGVQLLAFARAQGLGIRLFCGTGNEAMVTVEDVLEHLGRDPATGSVVLYLEGLKHGKRFFDLARGIGREKPIIALRGGRTGAGQRAALSHTGALASDARVFRAACRQSGVVLVEQPTDLLDLSAAFSVLPLPRGRRVGIVTWGGGWGVVAADLCAQMGLEVPDLAPGVRDRLDRRLPPYWSRSNPVDLVGEGDPRLPARIIEELLRWDGVDAVINLGMLGRRVFVREMIESVRAADPSQDPAFLSKIEVGARAFEVDFVTSMADLVERYGKPVVGVSLLPEAGDRVLRRVEGRTRPAVFFPTPERAVRVLARMGEYSRFRRREEGG